MQTPPLLIEGSVACSVQFAHKSSRPQEIFLAHDPIGIQTRIPLVLKIHILPIKKKMRMLQKT